MATISGRRGAEVGHHLQVRALHATGERVSGVVTDEGVLGADVVVAAGPWSSSLLEPFGVTLPILPVRGWLVRLAPGEPGLVRHIVERVGWTGGGRAQAMTAADVAKGTGPVAIGAALHPGRDGTITCGSSWQPALSPEPASDDPSVPSRIAAMVRRVVPALGHAGVPGIVVGASADDARRPSGGRPGA